MRKQTLDLYSIKHSLNNLILRELLQLKVTVASKTTINKSFRGVYDLFDVLHSFIQISICGSAPITGPTPEFLIKISYYFTGFLCYEI